MYIPPSVYNREDIHIENSDIHNRYEEAGYIREQRARNSLRDRRRPLFFARIRGDY